MPTTASHNQFAWMQSGELHMTMGKNSNAASVPLSNHKEANQDEVEVMSTDSSSSSSSDSQ